jgi:hypothetical protein
LLLENDPIITLLRTFLSGELNICIDFVLFYLHKQYNIQTFIWLHLHFLHFKTYPLLLNEEQSIRDEFVSEVRVLIPMFFCMIKEVAIPPPLCKSGQDVSCCQPEAQSLQLFFLGCDNENISC